MSSTVLVAPAPSHWIALQSFAVCVATAVPSATLVVPQQPLSQVLATHSLAVGSQSAGVVHDLAPPAHIIEPPPPVAPPPPVLWPPVPVVVGVVVPPVPPPTPPPLPPSPSILLRSTEAMSSQPVTLAVSAPAAITTAVKKLSLWFIR